MTHIILPEEAARLMRDEKALLVDVREPDEFRSLRIPGALLQPFSVLSMLAEDADREKPAVYFCRTGRRTASEQGLLESRGHARTYIIDGGILAWKNAGLPVEASAGPLPIMRQVHLAAGGLVLLFVVLGQAVPPLSWLAGLVGAGLVFSGLTGACGMAMLLRRMPWNSKQ